MADTKTVTIQTVKFGALEVLQENVIHFDEGILGFPRNHRFALVELDELTPFQYLQALDDPPIALLIINPFLLHPAYQFQLGESDMDDLQTDRPENVAVYSVATIPENPAEATINLMAPVLINMEKRRGKQVVLLHAEYPMRHPVFSSGSHGDAESA